MQQEQQIKRLRVMLALCLTLLACDRGANTPGDTAVRFPSLALQELDGGLRDIDRLRDRPLLVNYWATWCAPCRSEMPSLQRLERRIGDHVRVIGVTVDDDINLAREFVLKHGITFANFTDPGMRASRGPLGIATLPTTFLVSVDGHVLWHTRGARAWDDEDTAAGILSFAAAGRR